MSPPKSSQPGAQPLPGPAGSQRAQDFLELIERGKRGKLKIYIGSSAGVGKTYRMLQEAQALKAKRVAVVLGLIETHRRAETAALVAGLEQVPLRQIAYRGVTLEELDVEAVLARKPEVVLVDELAHTNAPGSAHEKRYQDVLQLVRAGINVITAVNIQHLESLNDLVARMTGVQIRETVPDSILREADQVVNLDLSVEDLRERLQAGKIYPPEKIQTALEHFFSEENLSALRELALREVAETAQREARRHASPEASARAASGPTLGAAPSPAGRVMLGLPVGVSTAGELVRKASRIAGRLNTHWYAVHVQRPGAETATLPAADLRRLTDAFELARSLGAEVVRIPGRRVVEALLGFARQHGVERILVGRSRPKLLARFRRSAVDRLVDAAEGFDVQVLSVGAPDPSAVPAETEQA